MKSIKTCLMFVGDLAGKAEEAAYLYVSVFNGKIESIEKYGTNDDGEPEDMVKSIIFSIDGTTIMAMDSNLAHKFSFTPSTSIFVECESLKEFTHAYNELVRNGEELVPIGQYGDSQKFGWLNDRYGVSWQLNLS